MGAFLKFIKCISWTPQLQKLHKTLKLSKFNCLQHNCITHYSFSKCLKRSTIFALSTPSGVSAIAVVRISGPNASDVLYRMGNFRKLPLPRKAVLCKIKDPMSEELLDKALVLWFPSPHSFTGEDMCELHIHGGIAVVKSILKALLKIHDFRMAEPGEFTKRAFLADKLDLTEVEGLSDLLHAETEIQQKQALRQMDGMLNKLYTDWSLRIKKCLANVEAYIDFSEDQHLDNTILKSVQTDLDKLKEELSNHISDYRRGERQRNGVFTILIGRPNVGKSSLFNSLCQRDIAIVSPTAGTTRDIIETSFNLDGYLVNISDTAGIRETVDSIEMEGVKRAKDRSSKADLLIFILEARSALKIIESSKAQMKELVKHLLVSELGEDFIKGLKDLVYQNDSSGGSNKIILLLNKVDLLNEEEKKRIMQLEDSAICVISCTEGIGMDTFLTLFKDTVKEMCTTHRGEEPIITQERHRVFIQKCLLNLQSYEDFIDIDVALAAEKLRIAMNELGKITGKVNVEDILDIVFRDFCIGK